MLAEVYESDIRHIVQSGVPVMGHIGLTPQHIHALGGFTMQGRSPEAAMISNPETDLKALLKQ